MIPAGATALGWQIHGLSIEALSWGDPQGRPVLALHGWLDNAASFALLAPHMPGCQLVALDLTGHGHSDRRSADATYQVWDDLPQVLAVADELGWEQFHLMGHSRGAIISSLLACAVPDRISRLVLLDAVTPEPVAEARFPEQIARFMADKSRLLERKARVYPSKEQAVVVRQDGSLPDEAAELIALRNLQPCEGGYTWRTDPRLRGASAVKLSHQQVDAVLAALTMPSLVLLAKDGLGKHPELADAARLIPKLDLEWIDGGHHFHMEAGAPSVAQRIERFLK